MTDHPPSWRWTEDPDDPCALCVQWRHPDPDTDLNQGNAHQAEPYWPNGAVAPRVYRYHHPHHDVDIDASNAG